MSLECLTKSNRNTIEALVCQQFYEEKDTIVDRTKISSVRIKNSSLIVSKIIDIFEEKLRGLEFSEKSINEHAFLIAHIFKVDKDIVWENILSSITALGGCEYGDEEQTRVVIYTFLIGSTLEALQRKVINSIIAEFLEHLQADDKTKVESLLYNDFPTQFSLLVNLSMLSEMSQITNINIDENPRKKMFSKLLWVTKDKTYKV